MTSSNNLPKIDQEGQEAPFVASSLLSDLPEQSPSIAQDTTLREEDSSPRASSPDEERVDGRETSVSDEDTPGADDQSSPATSPAVVAATVSSKPSSPSYECDWDSLAKSTAGLAK